MRSQGPKVMFYSTAQTTGKFIDERAGVRTPEGRYLELKGKSAKFKSLEAAQVRLKEYRDAGVMAVIITTGNRVVDSNILLDGSNVWID